jgi:BASS family bile acid:Na+ symporter
MSRAAGQDKNSARSVAFEFGLQNGAMASGLAAQMDKPGTIGLAAAIFSPWMNVSGWILVDCWHKPPVIEPSEVQTLKSKDAPVMR